MITAKEALVISQKSWDEQVKEYMEALEKEIERTKIEIEKPFAKETELEEKLQRLSVLNAELSLDKNENALVDETEEPSEDEEELSESEQEQEEEDRDGEER